MQIAAHRDLCYNPFRTEGLKETVRALRERRDGIAPAEGIWIYRM